MASKGSEKFAVPPQKEAKFPASRTASTYSDVSRTESELSRSENKNDTLDRGTRSRSRSMTSFTATSSRTNFSDSRSSFSGSTGTYSDSEDRSRTFTDSLSRSSRSLRTYSESTFSRSDSRSYSDATQSYVPSDKSSSYATEAENQARREILRANMVAEERQKSQQYSKDDMDAALEQQQQNQTQPKQGFVGKLKRMTMAKGTVNPQCLVCETDFSVRTKAFLCRKCKHNICGRCSTEEYYSKALKWPQENRICLDCLNLLSLNLDSTVKQYPNLKPKIDREQLNIQRCCANTVKTQKDRDETVKKRGLEHKCHICTIDMGFFGVRTSKCKKCTKKSCDSCSTTEWGSDGVWATGDRICTKCMTFAVKLLQEQQEKVHSNRTAQDIIQGQKILSFLHDLPTLQKGWLQKKNPGGSGYIWMFFVLQKNELWYFAKAGETKPLGIFPLKNVKVDSNAGAEKQSQQNMNAFNVKSSYGDFVLIAKSLDDQRTWIESIRDEVTSGTYTKEEKKQMKILAKSFMGH